jgi:competence protein ComEC
MMKRPLVVLILFYILGIIIGSYLKLSVLPLGRQVFYLFWIISGIFLLTLFFFLKKESLLTNLFLLLSFFLFGIFFCLSESSVPKDIGNYALRAREISLQKSPEHLLIGTVVKEPEIRKGRIFLTFKGEGVKGLTQVIVYNSDTSYNYGDRIKIKGKLEEPSSARNPGGFDYRTYLARKGIYTLVKIKNEENIEKIGIGKVNPLIKFALEVKGKMIRIIRQTLENPQAAVLEGIMFGKRSALPFEIREAFSNVGVAHILAVSGLHVMLVLFIFFTFFRASHLSTRFSAGLTIIFIVFYALIVGGRPSVIRASLMAVAGLFALILERDRDLLTSIALAAFIILLINPLSLFEISFQLSFMVVLSIIYLAPYLKSIALKFLPKWMALSFAVSLSAWLGALPLIAYYFNKVSPLSVIANLVVVPLTGIVVALGFLTSLSGIVSLNLAKILGATNWLALTGLIKTVKLFASLPYAFISVSTPSLIFIMGYYGSAVTLKIFFTKFDFLNRA